MLTAVVVPNLVAVAEDVEALEFELLPILTAEPSTVPLLVKPLAVSLPLEIKLDIEVPLALPATVTVLPSTTLVAVPSVGVILCTRAVVAVVARCVSLVN